MSRREKRRDGRRISQDGTYQWDGSEWMPIPPSKRFDFGGGQIWKVALPVVIIVGLLLVLLF